VRAERLGPDVLQACASAALEPRAMSRVSSCDDQALRGLVGRLSSSPTSPTVPAMRIGEDPAIHARGSRRPREHEVHWLRASVQEPERLATRSLTLSRSARWSTPGQGASRIRRYPTGLLRHLRGGLTCEDAGQRVGTAFLDAEEVRCSSSGSARFSSRSTTRRPSGEWGARWSGG
jgi:hypothetical protein